jgi:hypothetical protein
MMKGTCLKSRESLSYVRALSDHGFTDFDGSGFRELRACVTPAGRINMPYPQRALLRLFLFLICALPPLCRERRHFARPISAYVTSKVQP